MPIRFLAMPAAMLLTAGLTSMASAQDSRGNCSSEAAAGLINKALLPVEELKRLTGASIVRQIAPGDPVTMDFNERRLTVEVAGGKILRATCG
jgi:hypothetical protein